MPLASVYYGILNGGEIGGSILGGGTTGG